MCFWNGLYLRCHMQCETSLSVLLSLGTVELCLFLTLKNELGCNMWAGLYSRLPSNSNTASLPGFYGSSINSPLHPTTWQNWGATRSIAALRMKRWKGLLDVSQWKKYSSVFFPSSVLDVLKNQKNTNPQVDMNLLYRVAFFSTSVQLISLYCPTAVLQRVPS